MIILTAKLPRHRKLTIGVAVAALACCAALVLTLGGGPAREASASAVPSPKGVKSNEDRVAYLQSYGWEVSAEEVFLCLVNQFLCLLHVLSLQWGSC